MIFPLDGIARRAVGFVTDDKIKGESRRCLRFMHHGYGLIGGKNDGQSVRVFRLLECLRQLGRIRCGGIGHLRYAQVFFVAACLGIRTHGKAAQGDSGIRCPCPQGLGKQRDGRHKEQHHAAALHQLFRDNERGICLARTARHDELAALMRGKALHHGIQCFLLVRSGRLFLRCCELFRGINGKLRPVHGSGFQIFQRDDADRDGLAVQRIGGVLRQGSGGDDEPLRKAALAGKGEEVAKVAHGNGSLIELALDGAIAAAVTELCHKVNPRIRQLVAQGLPFFPVLPEAHGRKKRLILRVGFQIGAYQPFKGIPFVTVVLSFAVLL